MRGIVFFQAIISFLIVAFGQPSFAPWLAPVAAVVGYAIFWRAIRIFPFKMQRFWRGACWFGAVSLVQLSWMSSIEYQGYYIIIVWLSLSVFLALQFGFLTSMIPYRKNIKWPRILAIASLWTILEWSRFHVLCGYSWNLSGLALSAPLAIQFASVFGVLGLSFWVIFVNLLGFRALSRRGIAPYALWTCAACVPYLFGSIHTAYHQKQMAKTDKAHEYSCLLVQTGLLPSEKVPLQGKFRTFISPYDQWERILTYIQGEEKQHPDLIVLPEAVVPYQSDRKIYSAERVKTIFTNVLGRVPDGLDEAASEGLVSNAYWTQAISNAFDCEVVVGLDHVDKKGHVFNSAFHALPYAHEMHRYDKRVLMPLAEYIPFKWLTPIVANYGIQGSMTHGKEARIFEGRIPLAVSICYEETFPSKVREGRQKGAKLLVNITNDGWYPFSRLPSQHYEHARLRAIENGAPLLRACNTGVTAAVDSLGRTVAKMDQCEGNKQLRAGAIFTHISTYDYPTLFLFWGNWGIITLSLLLLGYFLLLKRSFHW